MRSLAPSLAALATLVATQARGEMPRYDVEAHCTEVAGFGGQYSAVMYDGCFEMEQQAYDALKPRWDGLAPTIRGHCDEVARFGGAGSYSMLGGCVEMEEDAAATDHRFQY